MGWSHSPAHWPAVIILLHWTMAAALIAMLLGGFAMSRAAHQAAETGNYSITVAGLPIFEAYQLHKSIGVLLFGLVLIRFFLRLWFRTPDVHTHMHRLEQLMAAAAHAALYALMLGLPISGWLLASSSTLGLPTVVFGLFEIPHPIGPERTREAWLHIVHWAGAWALVALTTLHVAAALKHHCLDHDDVLRAMLRARSPRKDKDQAHAK